jgi:hypothetical protein
MLCYCYLKQAAIHANAPESTMVVNVLNYKICIARQLYWFANSLDLIFNKHYNKCFIDDFLASHLSVLQAMGTV